MALLSLMSALYLTALNGTDFLNDSGSSNDDQHFIYVQARIGYNGTVKGKGHYSESVPVFTFMGIPYAKPPTGTLRFKRSEPVSDWSGERDATKPGHQCPQPIVPGLTDHYDIDEDCLYLNVYTPARDRSRPYIPVMVWIHGGGYKQMAGSDFDGSFLARKGVVLVTFNYRLGALGFMSTEDDFIPGNFGLLDQIQALQWVQKYIRSFGGDPYQVTIFGLSAGGTSVSLLTMSPLAKDLFHRAIMQSGVSLTPWAYLRPTTFVKPKTVAELIGEDVGCNRTENSEEFVSCLQQVDFRRLESSSTKIVAEKGASYVMVPRVESTYGILPDLPSKLLQSGQLNHIDTIRGYAAYESGGFMIQMAESTFRYILDSKISAFNITNSDYFINLFMDDYLGNATDQNIISHQATAASSDIDFSGPTWSEIKFAIRFSPERKHFLYKFDYRPSGSKQPLWVTGIHGDDLPFLFGFSKFRLWPENHEVSHEDQRVAEQLLTMWTNFAKTGDPTATVPFGGVNWEPFGETRQQQLFIRASSILIPNAQPFSTDYLYTFLQEIDSSSDTVNVFAC